MNFITENIALPEISRFFSPITIDYLNRSGNIEKLLPFEPSLSSIEKTMQRKSAFPAEKRILLQKVLHEQNTNFFHHPAIEKNLSLIDSDKTFFVTTAHQLNLMGGPAYFFYKAAAVIHLAQNLSRQFPSHHFIPLFWMATEDDDIPEIHSFETWQHTFGFHTTYNGIVKNLPLEDVISVLNQIQTADLPSSLKQLLLEWFDMFYGKSHNYVEATVKLIQFFFGHHGLLIIDPSHKKFKALLTPVLLEDLIHKTSSRLIHEMNHHLLTQHHYPLQAYNQPVNFFKIENNIRQYFRPGESYKETTDFCPNVLTRPLYQEILIPSIAFIGGSAEIAYWTQSILLFEYYKIPPPVLLLRPSFCFDSEHTHTFLQKNNIPPSMLFQESHIFSASINQWICSSEQFNIEHEKETLLLTMKKIKEKVGHVDPTLIAYADKTQKEIALLIDNLIHKTTKALKQRTDTTLRKLYSIRSRWIPDNTLQERKVNFSELYFKYGENKWIEWLLQHSNPLSPSFSLCFFTNTSTN